MINVSGGASQRTPFVRKLGGVVCNKNLKIETSEISQVDEFCKYYSHLSSNPRVEPSIIMLYSGIA